MQRLAGAAVLASVVLSGCAPAPSRQVWANPQGFVVENFDLAFAPDGKQASLSIRFRDEATRVEHLLEKGGWPDSWDLRQFGQSVVIGWSQPQLRGGQTEMQIGQAINLARDAKLPRSRSSEGARLVGFDVTRPGTVIVLLATPSAETGSAIVGAMRQQVRNKQGMAWQESDGRGSVTTPGQRIEAAVLDRDALAMESPAVFQALASSDLTHWVRVRIENLASESPGTARSLP